MNILFGIAGKPHKDESEKLRLKIESIYKISCKIVDGKNSGFVICTEDSIITGIAENEKQKLVLFGAVHQPVVEWQGPKSPLDDTHVTADHMLSLWQKYGPDFVGMASGSFAGCLFDESSQQAFVFSDMDGMRNLYYHTENQRIWFSSNPKLLAIIAPDISIDRSFENFFLVYGFWPDGRTAYQGIKILTAGQGLENISGKINYSTLKRHQVEKFPGSDFDFKSADFDDAVDVLYKAFMQALSDQTSGEEKVAVLLGGVDSALVASCLAKLGKKVETYSFYYDIESFNQPHADTLARYLGIDHHWVRITPEIILDGHKNWAIKYCQPTNWANYVIQTSHLCRQIKENGICRCYSGDGCDGTFLGYPNVHKSSSTYAKINRIPRWLLSILLLPMRLDISESLLSRMYTVGCNALRSLARRGPARGFLTFRVMDEFSLNRLRYDGSPLQQQSVEKKLIDLSRSLEHLSNDRLAYMGKNMVSPNKAKMNGCMDNDNITVLSPYLHPQLKQLVQKIPDQLLRPNGLDKTHSRLGKYILLKMTQKYKLLPDEIIYQRKIAAVDAPIDSWYSKDIRTEIKNITSDLPFEINEKYIDFLLKDHVSDRFYTRHFCSDNVTSHAISLLSTYATYTQGF